MYGVQPFKYKEKQYKSLDTPIKKKNFEEKTTNEFKIKQDAFLKL